MRTRVDIDEGQREKLLALAAERGERGCGRIIQEAVASYLEQRERPPAVVARVEPQPIVIEAQAASRAERVRLVLSWVLEEAIGLVALARSSVGRRRRSAQTA
jgi:hypothetical protein